MTQDWRDSLRSLLPDDHTPEETQAPAPTPSKETARLDVIVERKGRGGKVATIISGFTVDDDQVAEIASQLKRKLGTGGSARGGEILIQGDRAEAVVAALTALGLKSRKI